MRWAVIFALEAGMPWLLRRAENAIKEAAAVRAECVDLHAAWFGNRARFRQTVQSCHGQQNHWETVRMVEDRERSAAREALFRLAGRASGG
jgi:hypothetical protein